MDATWLLGPILLATAAIVWAVTCPDPDKRTRRRQFAVVALTNLMVAVSFCGLLFSSVDWTPLTQSTAVSHDPATASVIVWRFLNLGLSLISLVVTVALVTFGLEVAGSVPAKMVQTQLVISYGSLIAIAMVVAIVAAVMALKKEKK